MAVIASNEHRGLRRHRVDQLLCWQFTWRHTLIIPIAANDPFFVREFPGMLFDPPDKLIGRLRIAQIDIFELSASRNKVDMRVIKSWQNETFTAVDDLSFRAAPRVDLFLLANCNNSVSQDGN